MADQIRATGRRKTSVAQVRLLSGSGKFLVNGRELDDFFGYETLRTVAKEPLTITETEGQYDVLVKVNGGGYTLLPIRRVLEAFGGSVEWVPATNGVLCTLNGHQVELAPGSAQATVDGQAVTMDVPAEAKNDHTFVPVRFVSENLGLSVSYEPTNQIVVVSAAPVDQNNLTNLSSVKALTEKLASM